MKKMLLNSLFISFLFAFSLLGCDDDNGNEPGRVDPITPTLDIEYDVNLAKSAVVSASSFSPGYGPEKLVDGQFIESNEFYSSVNTDPEREKNHTEWISIKLNKAQEVNEVNIYPVPSEIHEGFPMDFKIQLSDDALNWKDVASIKDYPLPTSAEPVVIRFEPTHAAYIRLYAERLRPINNTWTAYKDVYLLRLAEIEVYMRSSQIKSIFLGSTIGIAGEKNKLEVDINTLQLSDGTKIKVELVKSDGTSLSSVISAEGVTKNNKAKITLDLPATLGSGDYKVKATLELDEKKLTALSDLYAISDKSKRVFYVSNSSGNDQNNGLSEATAIKTLSEASKLELLPGDKLLLKKGDVWEEQKLVLKNSGTPEYPIIVSSYGDGNKPHIKPNYQEYYGIRIVNASGYEISDIEVSNVIGGIVVWEENSYNHQYIKISNCFLHDMTDQQRAVPSNIPDLLYGMGISIAGSDNYGDKTLLSDIYIEDCQFDKCDVGIEVIGRDHDKIGRWNVHSHNKISRFAFLNVNIKNCDIKRSYRSGGVMLYCITGGKTENITIDQTGYNNIGMWWGVCAFQVARVSDYLVENCTFQNTIKGTSPDGQGFDWEADNHNVVVRNCRFLNNDGSATLNYGESWPGENDGCVLDGCYIEGNNKITNVNDDYYNRVFGINKARPANNGIVKNCEIHLRTNTQNYSSFPLVFDESNKVFNANGELIYVGVDRSKPILKESFTDLNNWINSSGASVSNGSVKLKNNRMMYIKNGENLSNYFSEAHFNFTDEGSAGISFGVSNATTYYLVKVDVKVSMKSTIQLHKVVNGKLNLLRSIDAFGLRPKIAFTLRVEANDSDIKVYSQGSLLGSYTLNETYGGSTGIYMGDQGECSISKFSTYSINK